MNPHIKPPIMKHADETPIYENWRENSKGSRRDEGKHSTSLQNAN